MDFKRLKDHLDRILVDYKVPGLDCIVYKEHEMIFRYFTGKSDVENGKEMTGNELYLIYSMTKMITCTAVLQLMEQGRILAKDPISAYLPEYSKMKLSASAIDPAVAAKIATGEIVLSGTENETAGYAKTPITIEHLLTMTAGFN